MFSLIQFPSYDKPWYRTWGRNYREFALELEVDSNSNVYFTGFSMMSEEGDWDIFVAKLNKFGKLEWEVMWSGRSYENGYDIALDSLNNIYVVGYTRSYSGEHYDLCLLKFNNSGDLIWNKTWGGKDYDCGCSIILDSFNNIYIAGITSSYGVGNLDICILKFNDSGSLLWNNTWGTSTYERSEGIILDSFGNVYITGYTHSPGVANFDVFLLKFNRLGILLWNATWGSDVPEYGHAISIDASDNVYISGTKDDRMLLLKYNPYGLILNNLTWGESNKFDSGYGIGLDSSDNIYITGNDLYKLYLFKFNNFSILEWEISWRMFSINRAFGLSLDSNNNIYIIGDADYTDILIIKNPQLWEKFKHLEMKNLLLIILISGSFVMVGISFLLLKGIIRKIDIDKLSY
ncbi:MAG: SBBP repeat-containing protein [Promethearchaeota archaeon]